MGLAKRLTLVLAESALELVPKEIQGHLSVIALARRRGKKASEMLLDRSLHHHAMRGLRPLKAGLIAADRRGRPDIVHFCLLEALGTPLNRVGLLSVYVHTVDDYILSFNPKVNLPRHYDRFVGLIEQLYKLRRVPPKGEELITLRKGTITELISALNPTRVVGLTVLGTPTPLPKLCERLALEERAVTVVGGFPRGHFLKETEEACDELVKIDKEGLDAWVVVGRLIYEYEKAIDLTERRLV